MTRQWRRGLLVAVMLGIAVGLIGASAVSAHARLKTSVPAANATLPAAPAQIVITFSEETSATKSGGSVTDAGGATVSTGFKVDLNERTKMTIDLKPNLPGGVYTVKWNTFTDDDSGMADGTFAFTVQGAQQAATAAPTTAPATTAPTSAGGTATTGSAPAGTPPAVMVTVVATTAPTVAPTATRAAASAAATGTGGATTLPATGNPDSRSVLPWLLLAVVVGIAALIAGFALRRRAVTR